LMLPAGVRREVVAADVETFLFTYSPELIVVSTSAGGQSKGMFRFLEGMIGEVVGSRKKQKAAMRESGMYEDDDDEDEDDDDDATIEVVYTRHDLVGTIFAASPRSKAEFPDYQSPTLRKAVCLARFAQEPLAELAYMWHGLLGGGGGAVSPGAEVLYLGLHPFANAVPQVKRRGEGRERERKRRKKFYRLLLHFTFYLHLFFLNASLVVFVVSGPALSQLRARNADCVQLERGAFECSSLARPPCASAGLCVGARSRKSPRFGGESEEAAQRAVRVPH